MRFYVELRDEATAKLAVESVRQRRNLRDQAAILIEQALANIEANRQTPPRLSAVERAR